ncbi:MAG TPA: amino acid ABC transporter ATP-binding protein [Tissierellia bacterium]|jgi:polar amino acid transport system ATP-binding protein|nr:amino acid ABC transporter ATP-binding protein [Tissierellia bacterium]
MLQVKNLSKNFGDAVVLKDLSFEVDAGEILAISGESGVGKTTLLRCICSLETPDAGEILVAGKDLRKNKSERGTEVGLVFQSYELFVHLSILDNLTLAPKCHKMMSEQKAREKARELLEGLGIADKAEQYPHQLSGGQQQRAAIARAMMLSPKVLCLDEPTSALDKESASGIARIIRSLAKENMCILLVSHDEAFASSVAHRTLRL